MSHINQRQTQKLLQKLSPQQIQMIKLLELPTLQLEQRVKQEIEENPLLEEERTDEDQEDALPKEVSVEEYFKEDDTPYYKSHINNYSRDDEHRPVYITEGMTFHDYLIEQLRFKSLSERELTIAKYLIGSIDDDGYLRRTLESVSDDMAFSMSLDAPLSELESVLSVIHELEPTGVGARNLQECLLLQLDAIVAPSHSQRLARKVIATYFDEFTKKHYEKLMSRLGVGEDEFRAALGEILHLSPKPGNLYTDGCRDSTPYIIPDFILDYQNGVFELTLNSKNIPEIKVNRHYLDMIREMTSGGDKVSLDANKDAMQFVKSKIDSAKWFISAIKQRHDTLMHTMQEILNYQREYFTEGDKAKLRPMILKDIADRTGLDVSTISRVVNSKYVQTQFGVLSLKQLFSEAMQTDSGEEVSSYEIKNILTECIAAESKRKPLTDEVLMDMLNDRGYRIARRTVAKYREMLGIPVARLRRKM